MFFKRIICLGLSSCLFLISSAQVYDYGARWFQVTDLESRNLTRQALDQVNRIQDAAEREDNDPQYLKTLLYQFRYIQQIEEASDSLIEAHLRAELDTKRATRKAVLHSLLADLYFQYYHSHSYQLADVTQTEVRPEDFQTWDARTFFQVISEHYLASVRSAPALQAIPVRAYEAILSPQEGSPTYRPTLYDLLMYRAISFFGDQVSIFPNPPSGYQIDRSLAKADAQSFVEVKLPEPTSQQTAAYHHLRLFQQLLAFHLNDSDPSAKVFAELALIKVLNLYILQQLGTEEQLERYSRLAKQYPNQPIQGEILMAQAELLRLTSDYRPQAPDPTTQDALKRAYTLCQQVITSYPNTSAAENAKALQSQIEFKSLNVVAEEINLANEAFRVLVTHRNLRTIYFRVLPLTDRLKKDLKGLRYYGQEERLAKLLKKYTPVAQWTTTLPRSDDYQSHTVEIKVPALRTGEYVLVTSDQKDLNVKGHAIALTNVRVSDLAYLAYHDPATQSHVLMVMDRISGKPLSNVEVAIHRKVFTDYYYGAEEELPPFRATMRTDEDGKIRIQYQGERELMAFVIRRGKEILQTPTEVVRKFGNPTPYTIPTTSLKVLTDRAIYRPGQPIYFKALAYQLSTESPKLIPNQSFEVRLHDVNGQVVAKQQMTSNAYGSLSGTFNAPLGRLTGRMSIRTDHGSVYFRVEAYKRPTFEVTLDTLKGSYTLNQAVDIAGTAQSYAGANLTNAKVTYLVQRQSERPWDFWRYSYVNKPPALIAQGETMTDATGRFQFDFNALPGENSGRPGNTIFRYEVIVDVVDISGETHSSQTSVRIGTQPLTLTVNMPEQLTQTDTATINLTSQNLNGTFTPTSGTLKVFPLSPPNRTFRPRRWDKPDQFLYSQQSYYQSFPHDVYQAEDDYRNWPTKKVIWETSFNTQDTRAIALTELARFAPGQYKLVAEAQGVDYTTFFTVRDSASDIPAVPTVLEGQMSQLTAEPYDTLTLTLATTEKQVYVHYRLRQGAEILEERWITVKRGQTMIEVPIRESYRGNVQVEWAYAWQNTFQTDRRLITVPWSNKELKLSWMTFRSALKPGQKESWKLKITGPKAEQVAAEMVATLYDASLDAFVSHNWNWSPYSTYGGTRGLVGRGYNTNYSRLTSKDWNETYRYVPQRFDQINWQGFYFGRRYFARNSVAFDSFDGDEANMAMPAPTSAGAIQGEEMEITQKAETSRDRAANGENLGYTSKDGRVDPAELERDKPLDDINKPTITPRRNLNETAFFFPQLETNAAGEIVLNFTVPEALTRWRFLGLAHTKDLEIGQVRGETVTQKELMVTPNLPRYFRQGDSLILSAKVTNLTDKPLSGKATLKLFNALNMQSVDTLMGHAGTQPSFTVPPNGNTVVSWVVKVPSTQQAITIQMFAEAGDFADGEERILPVLSNRMLVTESLPFALKGKEKKKKIQFNKLLSSGNSSTLTHQRLTFEVSSNPAWYAVQALPYLMEYPHECTEQIYSRFYANTLASHIANSTPRIRQIFDQWKQQGGAAFLSNLEKNPELKQAILAETPWVVQAKDEAERKRRMGLLFDLNRMGNEMDRARQQLLTRQQANGSFSWFPGMPPSRYITQLIATGFGHLQKMGIEVSGGNPEVSSMITEAVGYLDQQILKDYQTIKAAKVDLDLDHLDISQIQYLYMRSFFLDIPFANEKTDQAFQYYYGQAKTFWPKKPIYTQGMISLTLHRYQDPTIANQILMGLKENAVMSKDKGMYWKDLNGWFWWQADIERQALLIEAFAEVGNDIDAVEEMQWWLLQNKRTNDWKTTRATVAACNALLLGGQNYLSDQPLVTATVGEFDLDPNQDSQTQIEAGTGYYQVQWGAEEVSPAMGEITVKKSGTTPAWGAVYWQYFEELDKITYANTPLRLKKQLYRQVVSDEGIVLEEINKNTPLRPGDVVKVRLELRVSSDMSYVHMKDMRAAGFEPVNVLSGYKYQAGLSYYESTQDATTDFFFERLPEGTWVFEYPLRVNLPGDFSNGITTLQCMYAPEFTSHSEGIRVQIQE